VNNEWIKCSETLPPEKKLVLLVAIFHINGRNYVTDQYVGWLNVNDEGEQSWSRWPHIDTPTHWMTLPDPPTP
jgi:hypothetical protein